MTQIRAVCNWAVALGVIRGVNAGKSHRNLFRRHILRLLKHPVLFFSAILTLICINLNNEPNACLYFICIYYYCLLFEPFSVKNARQFWTYTSTHSGRSTQNNTTLPYFTCLDISLSSSKIKYSAENTKMIIILCFLSWKNVVAIDPA